MIAIVILNFNNSKDTIECLESLKLLKNTNFKVFIGDNSTLINEYKMLKSYIENDNYINKITNLYRIKKNNGFGSGNNYIMKKIDNNIYNNILLLNNDTIIKSVNLLCELENKVNLINNDKYIIGCKLLNFDESFQESRGYYPGIINEILYSLKIKRNKEKYDYLSGAFLFFNSALIKEIDGFDEKFFLYFEEVDFIYRAKSIGYKLYYFPETEVIHKGGKSTGNLNEFTVKNYLESMNYFLKKNFNYKYKLYLLYIIRNLIYILSIISIKATSKKNFETRLRWCKLNLKFRKLLLK